MPLGPGYRSCDLCITGQTVVFVASTIADFPAHSQKDFRFFFYTYYNTIVQALNFFSLFPVFSVMLQQQQQQQQQQCYFLSLHLVKYIG